jgi:hypothetical protein
MVEMITNVILGILVVITLGIVWQLDREGRFLDRLRAQVHGEDLPILDALLVDAHYTTFITVYLIALTVIGAAGFTIAVAFPPIRAINALLLLGLLTGTLRIGRALRRRVEAGVANGSA